MAEYLQNAYVLAEYIPGDIFLSMIDLVLKGPAMEYINGFKT